jgi:hypothetical protein
MYRHNCHLRLQNCGCVRLCIQPPVCLSGVTGLYDAGRFFIRIYKFFIDIWQDYLLAGGGGASKRRYLPWTRRQTLHIQAPDRDAKACLYSSSRRQYLPRTARANCGKLFRAFRFPVVSVVTAPTALWRISPLPGVFIYKLDTCIWVIPEITPPSNPSDLPSTTSGRSAEIHRR